MLARRGAPGGGGMGLRGPEGECPLYSMYAFCSLVSCFVVGFCHSLDGGFFLLFVCPFLCRFFGRSVRWS